jgi:hypothetical protein
VVAGLGAVMLVGVGWLLFGLSPLLSVCALVSSIALCSMAARAVAETDVLPLGQLGQLGQVAFAPLSLGQATANIAAAAVPAGAGAQTGLFVSSLSIGKRLGTPVAAQVRAQLWGVVLGSLVAVPAYLIVTSAYPLGSAQLPAPSAVQWKSVAALTTTAGAALPAGAGVACALGFAAGALLTLLARVKRLAPFVPSPIAMGASCIAPASYAITVAAGAILAAAVRRLSPAAGDRYLEPIAAGSVAGESLMAVGVAAARVLG